MTVQTTTAAIRAEIAALPRRNTPSIRALRKAWSARLKPLPGRDILAVATDLDLNSPQEGKWVAYELVRFHTAAFAEVTEAEIEDFARRIASWYATDGFGTILSGPLWAAGRLPDAMFEAWSRAESRWLRRSALVATVGLNAARPDPGRTFSLCLALAGDRDDMVEKAASWALRWLAQKNRDVVAGFMAEHGDRFASRVRREVHNKLATGRKNPAANRR